VKGHKKQKQDKNQTKLNLSDFFQTAMLFLPLFRLCGVKLATFFRLGIEWSSGNWKLAGVFSSEALVEPLSLRLNTAGGLGFFGLFGCFFFFFSGDVWCVGGGGVCEK